MKPKALYSVLPVCQELLPTISFATINNISGAYKAMEGLPHDQLAIAGDLHDQIVGML